MRQAWKQVHALAGVEVVQITADTGAKFCSCANYGITVSRQHTADCRAIAQFCRAPLGMSP